MTRLVYISHHKQCHASHIIVSFRRGYFNFIVLYVKFPEDTTAGIFSGIKLISLICSYRFNNFVLKWLPTLDLEELAVALVLLNCGRLISQGKSSLLKAALLSEPHTKIGIVYLLSSSTRSFSSVKVASESSPVKYFLQPK